MKFLFMNLYFNFPFFFITINFTKINLISRFFIDKREKKNLGLKKKLRES